MTQWQYRHLEGQARDLDSLVDALSFLGHDGWELVSFISVSKPPDAVACILKREVQAPLAPEWTDVSE